MARIRHDLIGQKFNRLTVKELGPKAPSGHSRYWCECDCGNRTLVRGAYLPNNMVKSCGCTLKEGTHWTHGLAYSPEYTVWKSMRHRCKYPHNPHYKNYGGRGITVCNTWMKAFVAFYADMGPRPTAKHTLERRDNSLGYFKENCYWATRLEQMGNTRRTVYVIYEGVRMRLKEAAEKAGLSYGAAMQRRRKYGWPEPSNRPTRTPRYIIYQGEKIHLQEAAQRMGIPYSTALGRYKRGHYTAP